jgi:transcriptional regulator with XRE-family HTH domain
LTQPELAAIGGTSRPTQARYESGGSFPDAAYLAAISAAGADVLYILTGRREPGFAGLSLGRTIVEALSTAHATPKPFPEHELPRLESAIAAVEEGLAGRDTPLPPDRKAALIVAAFDLLADASEASRARVIRLVKAT